MERRSFLRATALAGLASAAPWVFSRVRHRAFAQEVIYKGPYWVFVEAGGGWDPRFLFDPTENPDQNRLYKGIGQVGAIRHAAIDLDNEQLGWANDVAVREAVLSVKQFLERHGDRITVVNGIDTTTNNHDIGTRAMGSGKITAGYPVLAALIAHAEAPDLPISYLSYGGYDKTNDLVPLTRVANSEVFSRISRPNEMSPGATSTELFHSRETMERISRFQRERTEVMRNRQHLPALRKSIQELLAARAGSFVLDRVELPADPVQLASRELKAQQVFMQASQSLLAAFKSGLTASGTIRVSGFDTHGAHDRAQARLVLQLLSGIDYLQTEASRLGLADSLYVVVTSDFARGPQYNGKTSDDGKDHWPITSMFAMGPGIAGNRVVGETDDRQLAVAVDPRTLRPSEAGVVIGPADVHKALRKLAGLDRTELSARYPLSGAHLPLFG